MPHRIVHQDEGHLDALYKREIRRHAGPWNATSRVDLTCSGVLELGATQPGLICLTWPYVHRTVRENHPGPAR